MLTAVVINHENNRPSEGFFKLAKELHHIKAVEFDEFWIVELKRAHEFWSKKAV
jgi:hypothetical protein